MFKPPVDILLSNQRQGFCQSVREFSFGAGLEGAQGSLELRNAALNWIEVRGVCWKMHDLGPRRCNQFEGLGGRVKLDVVEQHAVPRAQAGDEQVPHVYNSKTSVLMAPSIIMGAQMPCTPSALITEMLLPWWSGWVTYARLPSGARA